MLRTLTLIILAIISLSASDKIRTIAYAQDDMANDFRKAQVYEVRDAFKKHPNINFIYSDAKAKTSMLIYQIDKFIKQKVDLLIVGTNDADAVVSVISKAYKNGIPVIILDRGINSTNYTTFINSDNEAIGTMGAKYIVKKLNSKGTVLLFEGLQKADVTQLRTKGFLDEISKHKDIKVIKRTGNYLRRDAIFEMEKILKEKLHVDAIFSESDSMLSGVRSAMLRFNKDPSSIVMIGVDYTSEAKVAILNETQSASIKFPLGGEETAKYAMDILDGQKVKKHILIPVKLITKKNAKSMEPIF